MGSKKKAATKNPKPVMITVKIPLTELWGLRTYAKKFAKGNLSAWLRHAGMRYRPKAGEIVKSVTMPSGKSKLKKKR